MKHLVIVLSLVCGVTMSHAQESKFKEKVKTKKDGTYERKVKNDGQVVYPTSAVQPQSSISTTTTSTTASHEAYGNRSYRSNGTVRHSVSTRRFHRVHHSNAHVSTRRHYVHVSHHTAKANHHKPYKEVKKKRNGKKYKVKYKY